MVPTLTDASEKKIPMPDASRANTTFESELSIAQASVLNTNKSGLVTIMGHAGVKHADSVKIKKDKLYRSFLLLNPETDRLNKNFQCTLCPKRFDKLSNVKDHVKTHLNSRPYSCHLCGLSFAQKGNRDRHLKR